MRPMLGLIGLEYEGLSTKAGTVIRTQQARHQISRFIQIGVIFDYYYARLH